MSNLHSAGYTESYNPFGGAGDDDEPVDTGKARRFRGKYRGSVVTNIDPLGQGRLLVRVPDVSGLLPTGWALPCVPFAGPLMGMYVVPPPVGAGIWVEFEQGDPDFPIWVGCFWDTEPVPPGEAGILAQIATKAPPGSPLVTIEVPGAGIAVTATPMQSPSASTPGNVTLFVGGTSITLSEAGISMFAPTISMTATEFVSVVSPSVSVAAPSGFNVNGTSLEVL